MEKAKKKKILFWVLVPLISALIIAGIVIGSVMSCAPKSGGPNTPVDPGPDDPPIVDPPIVDPPHQHQWVWTYTPSEHYQYCTEDLETRNRGSHVYSNSEDTSCNVCGYVRKLPTKQEDIEIEFDENGNAKIGGVNDTVEDLVIPGTVTSRDGKEVEVVEITEEAFKDNNNLNSLTILDGVKEIGANAFSGCSNLKEIYIPKTVTFIHSQAFQTCRSLTRIIVDENNTVYRSFTNCIIRIEDKCLVVGCTGTEIPTLKEGLNYMVTSIGEYAFYGSGITELVVPENISEIGTRAFANCTELTKFACLGNITQISGYTFNDCTALKTLELPDEITSIEVSAFFGCSKLDNIILPAELNSIGESAFQGCSSLKNITFNEKLKGIDRYAFRGCTALERVTLPASILGIGSAAFGDCNHLTSIVFAGTQEQWANVITVAGWKPNNVEVTFAADLDENEQPNPDGGDSGDTANDADNSSGSGDGNTDN